MLSKSKYIKGLQCEKRLWLDKHQPELKDEISDSQQARFDAGHSVGELAQTLFPGGQDASKGVDLKNNFSQWMDNTKKLMEQGETIIYEAAFNPGGAFAAMDILIKDSSAWRAIEVKSSTSVKDYHIDDAAVQYWILTQAGLNIIDIEIMHLNNEYVRQGDLDTQALFKRESVLNQILPLQDGIPDKMKKFKAVLNSAKVPAMDIGPHCVDPFDCDFIGHCWKHLPETNSIFSVGSMRGKEWELYDQGIYSLEDIPNDFQLSDKHRLHLDAMDKGLMFLARDYVRDFLDQLEFPLCFFDFETIGSAIPLFNNTKTYQQIPFQYSLHILESPGSNLVHKEFLADPDDGDPRPELLQAMIADLGTEGSIITWNKSFEMGKIKDLAKHFPEFSSELETINDRIMDLMIPFKKRWVYTAEMNNSASIKAVLPALVPDIKYDELEIKEGGTASETFLAMLEGRFKGNYDTILDALRKYCELDTLAMVKIYEKLILELGK